MSYQVLARKWRPQTFKEVIGQPHVLTALENGLTQDRVHHAYLFSGTRGVGKTTIARILAKSLNCETGVTATPCGKCDNCLAIDQGRFVDLLEIDAASRTKVDDTRELLDNVQYKPAQGRYKVYLIDEVHMLSKHSFNALLKTLEEPPEYVKFLLATTDPQKLPITVLSRCLQFHLKAILPEQIEQQLASILNHEKATFEHAALSVIAKAADGSMRDALSLTDQALAFGAGHIEYAAVLKMLGTIDQSHLHYLLHFIASGNSQKVFEKIQEFVHLGADFSALHQELASLCHQIALIQLQLNANVTEKTAVQLLAERLTPEEVQLFYQIAVQGFKDYAYAPNGKIALEMTVMRLLAFKPANYVDIDQSMLAQANKVETVAPVVTPQSNIVLPSSASENSLSTTATQPNESSSNTTAIEPVEEIVQIDSVQSVPVQSVPTQEVVAQVEINQSAPIQELPAQSEVAQSAPAQQSVQAVEHTQQEVAQQQPAVEQFVTPVQPVTESLPLTAEAIVEPIAQQQPGSVQTEPNASTTSNYNVVDSSSSRNMLRSHRLKREALKKTEAATEQQTPKVQDRFVAPAIKSPQPSTVEATVNKAVEAPLNLGASSKNIAAQPEKVPFAKPSVEKSNNEQELPPLSSYQQQPSQSAYDSFDGDSFEDNSFENGNLQDNSVEGHYQDGDYDRGVYDNSDHTNNDRFTNSNIEKELEDRNANNYLDNSVANSNNHDTDNVTPKPVNTDAMTAQAAVVQSPIIQTAVVKEPVNDDISGLNQSQDKGTDVMLVNDPSLQSTEIDIPAYVENKMTDPWFLAIKAMQLVGFEKLLAKSCVMQKEADSIALTLHQSQQHLLNNQSLCEDLKARLREHYGQQYTITIEAGEVAGNHTPMELEMVVYQQYLDNAKTSIKNDAIVQTFVRDYAAKVYENSVVPL